MTRNDAGLGLVNRRTAEVAEARNGEVAFRLEDGKRLSLREGDPQLRRLDHALASTMHAFQGRTVDSVIAAMEASHPHLTTQKSFYVEISRARDRAELVTDDAKGLCEQLLAVTGERISALAGIGEAGRERGPERERSTDGEQAAPVSQDRGRSAGPEMGPDRAPKRRSRSRIVVTRSVKEGQSGHGAEFYGLPGLAEFCGRGMSTVVVVNAAVGWSRIRML